MTLTQKQLPSNSAASKTILDSTSLAQKACLKIILLIACLGAGAGRVAAQADAAREILDASGVRGGLVVQLGCGDGKLTAALRVNDSFIVHGLDTDAAKVTAAREHIRSLDLYGKVSVEQWSGPRLPYADNLVNLVVAEKAGQVPMEEVLRVLAPNGVALIRDGQAWRKTAKPRPSTLDEWTHFLHGPDNNAVAHDSLVGAPDRIQWVGGPKWARHHNFLSSTSAMVTSGGRLFIIVDEGSPASLELPPNWQLVARDAFNGVVLWKKPIGPWEGVLRSFRSGPVDLARRLVAVGDRVFVTPGYLKLVVALDAATGKTIRTYAGTEGALEIVCEQGVLYVVAGSIDPNEYAQTLKRATASPAPQDKRLLALNVETGAVVWRKADADTQELLPTTLAVSGGQVYFHSPKELICLKDGKVAWRAARPLETRRPGWSAPTLVIHEDVVLCADQASTGAAGAGDDDAPTGRKAKAGKGGKGPEAGQLIAFSARDGKVLWRCPAAYGYNAPPDVLFAGGLVWVGASPGRDSEDYTEGRDLHTGLVKQHFATDPLFSVAHHHRCYRDKATDQYLFIGRTGVELIGLAKGELLRNCWVRGACQYGVMPANGLLYAPPHACACYIQSKLSGLWALAPQDKTPASSIAQPAPEQRLEHGPGFPAGQADLAGRDDPKAWPTLRGDMARTGRSRTAVPTNLRTDWQTPLGGKLSSPVIGGGKLLVAAIDRHLIQALDAASGKPAWQFTAGGRIDSPPSIVGKLAVFGCADGYVYCLRLDSGQLVWRYQAAPLARRIVAFDQLESVWPVTGTPLVRGETVYCTAGRSSFLDGGMSLLRLDLLTGKLLGETKFNDRDPATGKQREDTVEDVELPGALPDVLVDDGRHIYLRDKVLNAAGVQQAGHLPHLYCSAGLLDDNWWHRTAWMWGERDWGRASGWAVMPGIRPSGRILVTDDTTVFGYGPKNVQANTLKGYQLFRANQQVVELEGRFKNNNAALAEQQKRARVVFRWSREVPFLARGLALAANALVAAGPVMEPGAAGANVPSFDSSSSPATLMIFGTEDGRDLARFSIDGQPVFDGLALAGGKVYVATVKGNIICLGGK